jgi:arylsulfatase
MERFSVTSNQALPAGASKVRLEFDYDGGGAGQGGVATLYINDQKVGSGRIEKTQPAVFSGDEGVDVGEDGETPVVNDYGIPYPYKFTGKLVKVTVTLKKANEADKTAADSAKKEAGLKKALAD